MKSANVVKGMFGVTAVVFALNGYAQSSAPAADSASMSAPAPSAKEARAANRALAKKVHRALARTKGLDPTHIYVKVVGGDVTLSGSCQTQHESDLAGTAAQGVDGVTSVSNKLTVRSPS